MTIYFGYELLIPYVVCRCFLPFPRLPFTWLIACFAVQRDFCLLWPHLTHFCCNCFLLLGCQCNQPFSLSSVIKVSPKSFMGSGFALKPLIHCELAFVCGARQDWRCSACGCPVSPALSVEDTVLSSLCALAQDRVTVALQYIWQ